jgi:hypothetical protein
MEFYNFIGIQKNFLSDDQCDSIIDAMYDKNLQYDEIQIQHNSSRSDSAVFIIKDSLLFKEINDKLSESLNEYNINYHLRDATHYKNDAIKIQVSEDGGGFHNWHSEWDQSAPLREIVWMVYLNDDFEGGHTEFEFLNHSEKPETGKLLLFPAGYTHRHRASPKLKGQKYIITGWFER